jgi:uncharacterized membrane-anchored protein
MRISLAAAFTLLFCGHSLADFSDQQIKEVKAMHWKPATGFRLVDSKSSIGTLPDFQLIAGPEARRFREIIDGKSDPQQEADVFNSNKTSEIIYEWFPSGFVKSDDWADVDADSFLSQLKELDVEANKIRQQKGLPTLTTTGWRQKPTLNQDTNTVSWAIEGVDSEGAHVLNFDALKLGRYGFEKIIWVIDPNDMGDRNDLLLAVNSHHFDNGARYVDYVASTDHSAEYGVAGLVAGAIGVKVLKVAGAGAAIIALKKFAFILILPFIYAWRKITGLFKRKPGTSV